MSLSEIPTSALVRSGNAAEPPRVLVADDEEDLRIILERLLSRNGFRPLVAADVEEARTHLQATPVDAVLADLHLGPASGLTVLGDAARLQPGATRMLMSANVDLRAVLDVVNGVGVYQVVEKPLVHDDLLAALDRAVSLGRVTRERDQLQAELATRAKELERLNRALEDTVQRRTADLLCGLLGVLDWRDTESTAHSRRVAAYARRLGRQLGLAGTALADVTAGALLHDVGKIGVPDHVLRKPDALTPEEWSSVQRHPALGDELLKPIAILQGARRVVLQHHERWDGTGYPSGLQGPAIDIGARIFAVVDAHDAITSDRPHRRGRPISSARELIALASGTQFDPDVVAAWSAVPDSELRGIAEAYRDDVEAGGIGELLAGL